MKAHQLASHAPHQRQISSNEKQNLVAAFPLCIKVNLACEMQNMQYVLACRTRSAWEPHRMCQQIRWAAPAAVLLISLLLVTPAAAGRQLKSLNHLGKGPRYVVAAPAVGAFVQQRTYFAPAAPVVASYVQQQPVVASYVQQQPMYIAQQPTVVAAQPTYVAAQPTFTTGGPHKANLGVDVNLAVGRC